MEDAKTLLWICVMVTGLLNPGFAEAQLPCFQNCTLVSPQHWDCDHERLLRQDSCIIPYDTISASLRYNDWESMDFIGRNRVYRHLENLTVSNNHIKSIGNGTFTQTPYLVHLDMSYNFLTSIHIGELPLPFLQNMSLYSNLLRYDEKYTPVDIFKSLTSLKFLDFRLGIIGKEARKCPSPCPKEVGVKKIRHLKNLEELRFTTPQLFPLEGSLSNLTKLRCVIISECTIGTLTNKTFAAFRDLPVTILSLRKTKMVSIERGALRHTLPFLRRIDVSCNENFGNDPRHIDDFWANFNGSDLSTFVCDRVTTALGTFNMSLDAMRDATSANIQVMSIRGGKNFRFNGTTYNPNATLDFDIYKNMFPKLRYMRAGDSSTYEFFTGSDLRNVESSPAKKLRIAAILKNLRVFDAPSAQMAYLDISYESRINCEELDPLLFQDPPDPGPFSTDITDDEIEDDIFNLSNILSRYLIEGKITPPPRLQEILLPSFGAELTKSACPGGTIAIYERNNIKKVHMSGTKIPQFNCIVTGFLYLEDLTLRNMEIEEFYHRFFITAPELRRLDLSHNRLGSFLRTRKGALMIKGISAKLQVLLLTRNGIWDFSEDNVLAQFTNLTTLDLSDNFFTTLSLDLSYNSRLEYVNLTFNKLAAFEYVSRHPIFYNFNVSLHHNGFLCTDCGSLPFIDWLFSSEAHRRVLDRLLLQCQNHEYEDEISLVRYKNITSETSLRLQYDCRKDRIYLVSGGLLLTFFSIAALILAMESDYRWKIVHWWYFNYYKVKRVFHPFNVLIPRGTDDRLVVFLLYRSLDRKLAKSVVEHLEGSRVSPHHICMELKDICKPTESEYEFTGLLVDTCDLVIPIVSDSLEDSGDMEGSHGEEQGPSGNDGTGDRIPGLYSDEDDDDEFDIRVRRRRELIHNQLQQPNSERRSVTDTIYEFGLSLSLTKGIDSIIFISKNLEPDRFPHFPRPVRNLLKKSNCCIDVGGSDILTDVARCKLDGIVECFLNRKKYV